MRGGKIFTEEIFTAALLTAKFVKFTYCEKFQVYGSLNTLLIKFLVVLGVDLKLHYIKHEVNN